MKLHTAEILVPQVQSASQATQVIIVQLRSICDSALHAYLSKVADTAKKRHYLHASCTAVDERALEWFKLMEFDPFLEDLYKFKIFDLHLSIFQPYNLRVLLTTMSSRFALSDYIRRFRSDPERSREFHYEDGLWHAFVATRYMRFLRVSPNSR